MTIPEWGGPWASRTAKASSSLTGPDSRWPACSARLRDRAADPDLTAGLGDEVFRFIAGN